MSYVTERLIKNARVSLPGSLDDAILLELFNVLDQFFRESGIWTEVIPFSVQPGDPVGTVYYIEPESVSTIVRLYNVANTDGIRQRAAMSIPGEVTFLTPPPNQEPLGQPYYYTAHVTLSIVDPVQRDGYPEFPEWTLEKYGTGILSGLLGRMMAQPAKPYTNPQLAASHLAAFRRTISVAATESLHRNLNNAQAWVYPRSFATRSNRR
jgi:hypothetical protein